MHASSTASNHDATTTLGGSLWVLSGVQFAIAQFVVAAAWSPPYSWTNNYISDLGNTACGDFAVPHGAASYVCSPLAPVMNASFIVSGVLVIGGVLLLVAAWQRRRITAATICLWLIAGLGKIGVGLVPENTNINLHLLAACNIPLESVASLLLGVAVLGSHKWLGLIGIGLAVLGFVGTLLGIAGEVAGPSLYLGLGPGGIERLAEYPATLWRFAFGAAVAFNVARTRLGWIDRALSARTA